MSMVRDQFSLACLIKFRAKASLIVYFNKPVALKSAMWHDFQAVSKHFFNRNSLHARLNSYYKACSCKKSV